LDPQFRIFLSDLKFRCEKSRVIDLIKHLKSRENQESLIDLKIFEFSIFKSSNFMFSKDYRTHAITSNIIHLSNVPYAFSTFCVDSWQLCDRFYVAYCCQSSSFFVLLVQHACAVMLYQYFGPSIRELCICYTIYSFCYSSLFVLHISEGGSVYSIKRTILK